MSIERILSASAAGPLLGGLSWRPPSGGRHSMRRLHEARNLTVDATHFTLFAAERATVYGLFQPRASEELVRLPKGVQSAAHCFAALVGQEAPNGALILTVPADEFHKTQKVYVVVLEDGVPVVDSLTSDMEARNALGSEDRPLWSDSPASFPNCEPADFEWLAKGASKASRVASIPVNPWPWVTLAVVAAVGCSVWFYVREARLAEQARLEAQAVRANDPAPRYLAALDMQMPSMAADRHDLLAVVEGMFDAPVVVPGWAMKSTECHAARRQCESLWARRGGTYDELRAARPGEQLAWVNNGGNAIPVLDAARTTQQAPIGRHALPVAANRLPSLRDALNEVGSVFQVWKTANLSVDMGPPQVWPRVDAVPQQFEHPRALLSGAITVNDVPGPFILEALRTAPPWISWESVRAEIGDGDPASRLKFKATGVYYVSLR